MNQLNSSPKKNTSNLDEEGIAINDIVLFLKASWAGLVVAGVFGSIVSLGLWYFKTPYSAQYTLTNTINEKDLSLAKVNLIEQGLSTLASNLIERGKMNESNQKYYPEFSDFGWWKNNIIPTHDQTESKSIVKLTFLGFGKTKDDAILMSQSAANFYRVGAAYLNLQSAIKKFTLDNIKLKNQIDAEIQASEFRLIKMHRLVQFLKKLKVSNTGSKSSSVIIDNKELVKYIPLENQINGVSISINEAEEELRHLHSRSLENESMKIFLDEARFLLMEEIDGLALGVRLLEREAHFRNLMLKNGGETIEEFNQLRKELLLTQIRSEGLQANLMPHVAKPGIIRSTLGGFMSGFLLALLMLLSIRLRSFFEKRFADGII